MKKDCAYCKKTFEVQRVDSVYCSRSCRQMAYMERKMERMKEAKLNGAGKSDQPREPNMPNSLLPAIREENAVPKLEAEYQVHNSKLLDRIREQIEDDRAMSAMHACIRIHQDIHSYWVGERLRCLVECLLMFSEAKFTSVADLMELCNAFTTVQRSIHYQNLPQLFPYRDVIDGLREKLRRLCIKAQKADQLKFRIDMEDKISLITVRYGLAQFFSKQRFSDLEFSTS